MIPNLEEFSQNLIPEQRKQFEEDRPYLEIFIKKYKVPLVDIRETSENFPFPERELMYFFDDNLGGYTIEGVKRSVEE